VFLSDYIIELRVFANPEFNGSFYRLGAERVVGRRQAAVGVAGAGQRPAVERAWLAVAGSGQHAHAAGVGAAGDLAADGAVADDADRLAAQLAMGRLGMQQLRKLINGDPMGGSGYTLLESPLIVRESTASYRSTLHEAEQSLAR